MRLLLLIASLWTAAAEASTCELRSSSLVSAEIVRGRPSDVPLPTDATMRKMAEEEDHFDKTARCTYATVMNGQGYQFMRQFDAMMAEDAASHCAANAPTQEHLDAWTQSCTVTPPGLKAIPCEVSVVSLVSASNLRGVPYSASRARSMAAQPDGGASWRSRDHAMSYARCRFQLALNGTPYTYDLHSNVGFDAPEAARWCATQQDAVVTEITQTTYQCASPQAGAYWGKPLKPVEATR